jgi:ABC-type lipoprotein export system ATPase subunit
MMELIKLHELYKTYHIGEISVPVLKGVSLVIDQGELVALMGASGSGKSTLMNILGCLDRPTSGEYWLEGKEVSLLSADERALVRNQKLGFVFQNFNLLPRTSALENVAMPLSYSADHLSEREARRRAEEMLAKVGLQDRLDQHPSSFRGQQQRVAIARALNRPSFSLRMSRRETSTLEPARKFSACSSSSMRRTELIILVTHDPNVAKHARLIIQIHDGVIVSSASGSRKPS